MLIGIDASRANREHKSGTEWYSYYLIRWLSKLDSKNQYILYTDKPLRGGLLDLTTKQHFLSSSLSSSAFSIIDREDEGEVKFDKDGNQILKSVYNNFKAKVLKWPFSFLWTQGRMSLEMIFNKPDILFIPSHVLPLIHPRKSMVTLHDIGFSRDKRLYGPEQMGPENKRGRRIINFIVRTATFDKYGANSTDYQKWSTLFALKNAKKIITVSHFSKKELIDVYGGERNQYDLDEKINVIHNGYNKYLYKKADNNEIEKALRKYDIDRPYILYVGRLEKKKNTPALIEAFGIMREKNKNVKHKLVLVGDASFGYDEVKYMVNEYDLEDKVIIPGWIEETDMPYIYCGSSAFVFPSLYEGFGIPIIQAMACGIPVAASRIASIPEIAGAAAVLFNPRDVDSMAEALERIIIDCNLKNKLIAKGKEQAGKFSWEKCAKSTLEVIENIKYKK